ncbi:MAG TPA: hypothetical protein VGK22_03500 [Candidatus Angelobacter sp.]|jgi:hypothetical protein
MVSETDLAGTIKSEYIFLDGERVARRGGVNDSGGVFYYFSDHLETASVISTATPTTTNSPAKSAMVLEKATKEVKGHEKDLRTKPQKTPKSKGEQGS